MVNTKLQSVKKLTQTEAGKTCVGDFSAKNSQNNSFASTQLAAPQFRSAAELETAIWRAAGRLMLAVTYEEKCAARDELDRLHWQRSPEVVERMERRRGLKR